MIDLDAMGEDEVIPSTKPKAKPLAEQEAENARAYWRKAKIHAPNVDRRRHEMKLLAQHSSESVEHYTPAYIVAPIRTVFDASIDLDPCSCDLANEVVGARRFFGHTWREDPNGETVRRTVSSELSAEGKVQYIERTYTRDFVDGLVQDWSADNIVLNPPGGLTSKSAPQHCGISKSYPIVWWGKFIASFLSGRFKEGLFVAFTLEVLTRTQNLPGLPCAFEYAVCYPRERIPYDYPNDTEEGIPLPDNTRASGTQPAHASGLVYVGPNVERFVDAYDGPIGKVVVPR